MSKPCNSFSIKSPSFEVSGISSKVTVPEGQIDVYGKVNTQEIVKVEIIFNRKATFYIYQVCLNYLRYTI